MAAATIVPIVLNLKNYDDWTPRVKTYLMAEDLWDIVEGIYKKPPLIDPLPTDGSLPIIKTAEEKETEIKAWKMKNVKALYAIQNSCGDDTYQFIKSATTAKEAWDTLLEKLNPGRDQSSDRRDERILVQAYPTRTIQHDAIRELAKEEGRTGGLDESSGNDIRETFVKSVKSGDWDNAIKLLRNHHELGSERISDDRIPGGGTALHYALWNFRSRVRIIKQLVESMTKEDLEIQDNLGLTALFLLITFCQDRVDVAKSMVEKNDKLLSILPANTIGNRTTPLVVEAQRLSNGERMARYLYSVTPHDTLHVSDAAQLISLGFHLHRFDIAWDLIQRYPQLGMAKNYNGDFPLLTLASNRSAFLSGCRLNFWENLIYYGIRMKHLPSINNDIQSDQGHVSDQKENQSLISVVLGLYIRGLVTKLQELLGGGECCRSQ
ncbi:uncharacterized protein LOC103947828 isoform X2 [Pyrus x bretschneideri]|uniref:uncharacterized protein LOC103947828 isoform X2 n=1 Tax=Pyrus x bretschneideri TaxID=225117 RepID=UPI0020307F83|nr:uncharacterized protein LOC103947828 isoform X2 [Pyrus x bretschneideri]